MSIQLELPNITADNFPGQVAQLKSYLYQMVQQLQWAFDTVESSSGIVVEQDIHNGRKPDSVQNVRSFDELKSLIIKSADIVEAYYGQIDSLLSISGHYVGRSDFGTYKEDTAQQISANSTSIQQNIQRVEDIDGWRREQSSYIRYGAVGTTLDEQAASTAPGIEIGDYQTVDGGTVTSSRFARFTAYGLELFGASIDAPPVAYIKQRKLYISNAEITSTLKLGGYVISSSDGMLFDWVGG